MGDPLVSIIVPVLRDTIALADLLSSLPRPSPPHAAEVVVVSGEPATPPLAALAHRHADVTLVESQAGRAVQMNVGAARARGRWLLFVHADSRLGPRWLDEVRRADADPRIVGGSFRFVLDSPARAARIIERGVGWRVAWFGLPYGDQALFVRRDVFAALDGYRGLPLMEDVDLVQRLKSRGRILHSREPVRVSARRWERDGWFRRSCENVVLVALFLAGVDAARLARRYYRRSPPPPQMGDPDLHDHQ